MSKQRSWNIDPLSRGALRHDVVRRLLEAIFEGELPAGTHLVARTLADRLGISPTPIRESLVELEQLGLVELSHNRGAVVRPFGRQQLAEFFHIRRILEVEAVRCACGRLARSELQSQRQRTRSLLDSAKDGDARWVQQVTAADRRFHETIAGGCGNKRLSDEIRRYNDLLHSFCEAAAGRREVPGGCLQEHLKIVDALLEGDAARAASAMAAHVDSVGKWVEVVVFQPR